MEERWWSDMYRCGRDRSRWENHRRRERDNGRWGMDAAGTGEKERGQEEMGKGQVWGEVGGDGGKEEMRETGREKEGWGLKGEKRCEKDRRRWERNGKRRR
jgi:hypothetical protein